jgi:serine phosphatase RsbU (regulator of sigma subunit)/anti-sigma regulatory factor (Ser/Thr protein kinase)
MASAGQATDQTESADVLDAVRQLADTALAYMSLEELLLALLDRIRAAIGADTAAVLLLDRDREVLIPRAARGIEEEVRQAVQIPLGRGFAGRIAAERRPIVIEDVDHADIHNPILRERGIRSLLGVPLLVDGLVVGVLHVGTLHERKFVETDVRLLELAAARAALAIDRAQLSEQRALTELLQRTLLPQQLSSVPGMRFSAKYLPGQQGVRVGGDWYDVFPLSAGRIAFVIGDVVGRGIVAASVMTEIRTAVRAYAMEKLEPAEMITRLDALIATMGRNRSATVAFYVLDIERERLCASSAGHLPGLLLTPEGEPRYVALASGPPLGFGRGRHYTQEELEFVPGSTLLLYSDGLIERRHESIDDGFERLLAAAMRAQDEGGAALAERIYARLVAGEQAGLVEDDVALLSIEWLPIGPRLQLQLERSPQVLPGLRRALVHWLAHLGVAENDRFDVALACSEAANHAIAVDRGLGHGSFELDCTAADGELRLTIRHDAKQPLPPRRELGHSLTLMSKLMDSVELGKRDDVFEVRLVKRLPRSSQ